MQTIELRTSCPHCDKTLKVRDDHLGKSVRCSGCGQSFEVQTVRSGRDKSLASSPAPQSISNESSNDSHSSKDDLQGPQAKAARETTVKKLGRFEIKGLIGEGGFGRVYRAYAPQLDRMVALKIPSLRGSDSRGMKRFLTEAKAAAQLRHPNIVPTFDAGKEQGQPYIASSYIDGQTLDQRIKQGTKKITPRQAARWVTLIASAVHYAHEQGIVHRDIKPHNVMLDERDQPQLMDFGLAKRVGEDSNMTIDGTLMGTPSYMSPEQARGDHSNVGPPSDQYSVGVLLYELLLARPHSVDRHTP